MVLVELGKELKALETRKVCETKRLILSPGTPVNSLPGYFRGLANTPTAPA